MSIFNQVKSDNKVTKNFNFSKGKCTLSFNLRTDIKTELRDFLDLLKVAEQEVSEELNKQ